MENNQGENQGSSQNTTGSQSQGAQPLVSITREAAETGIKNAKIDNNAPINQSYKYEGFSETHIRNEATELVRMGALTPEQGAELLRANGLSNIPTKVHEIDQMFPPAKPHEFQNPSGEYGRPLTENQQKNVSALRNVLSDARFTSEMGSFLLQEAVRTDHRWQNMKEGERASFQKDQMSILQDQFKEKLPQMLDHVNNLVDEIEQKHPGFRNMMDHSGASNSAMIIAQMALHAERLYERAGSK